MATYNYPAPLTLKRLGERFEQGNTAENPIFNHFPMVTEDTDSLSWVIEHELTGLQQARGVNGAPKKIAVDGEDRYVMEPGYFGEFRYIDEKTILSTGNIDRTAYIDISEHVAKAQKKLIFREMSLVIKLLWDLVLTGQISVVQGTQTLVTANFNLTPFSAPVDWSTRATATPLKDIEDAILAADSVNANWDSDAILYLNRAEASNLYNNANAADLGGYQPVGSSRPFGLDEVNDILEGRGLPQVKIVNSGYKATRLGSKIYHVPNSKAVIIGKTENGDPIGDYTKTRVIQKTGSDSISVRAGSYDAVEVLDRVPYGVEVHRGHNGGSRIYNPQALIPMNI